MNIIKKRTPKFLSATFLSFALVVGTPTPAGGESLSLDLALNKSDIAQKEKEPFIDTLELIQETSQTRETIKSMVEDMKTNYSKYLIDTAYDFLDRSIKLSSTTMDEETLQKIYNDCNTIYEQIKQAKFLEEQQEYELKLVNIGNNIQSAAYNTHYCVRGMCAAYVSHVFQNAGYGYIGGNANDMYWRYCNLSDKNAIRAGMIIAVAQHDLSGYSGRTYGHVGVIIKKEDNLFYVRDNVGYLRDVPIDQWIEDYNNLIEVRWGWAIPV